ncbi:MAG TPA: hypothetical protein VM577_08610 [Anaerovoracaceae bacterium]|nr:hypothetical protein [Anaerovoracaceae bacterium]
MTFDQIISALRETKKVRRVHWGQGTMVLGKDGNRLVLLIDDGKKFHKDCYLDAEDLMANDWEIV